MTLKASIYISKDCIGLLSVDDLEFRVVDGKATQFKAGGEISEDGFLISWQGIDRKAHPSGYVPFPKNLRLTRDGNGFKSTRLENVKFKPVDGEDNTYSVTVEA